MHLQRWDCRTSQCQTAGINTWGLAEVDFCAGMATLLSEHLLAGFDNRVGTWCCAFLYGVAVYYCCQTKNRWRKLTISPSFLLIPATLKDLGCALARSSSPGEGTVWDASEWWVGLLGSFPTNFAQAESSGKLRAKAKDDCSRDGSHRNSWSWAVLEQENLQHPCQWRLFLPVLGIRSPALQLELGAHTSCRCRVDFAASANVPCQRV